MKERAARAGSPSRNIRHRTQRLAVLTSLLGLLVLPVPAFAQLDNWQPVLLSGWVPDTKTTAMAIRGDYVYVGTADGHVYRATIRDDTVWTDALLPGPAPGFSYGVTDMASSPAALYVSTSGGGLWRLDDTDSWTNEARPSWGSLPIHAITFWSAPGRTSQLCLARSHVEVLCRNASGGWDAIPTPVSIRADAGIQSARLQGLGSTLYLGIGGGDAGTRTCALWQTRGASWNSVTVDCFGHPGLTWVSSMGVFNGALYVGTGGHGSRAVLMRLSVGGLEDVTPCDPTYPLCTEPLSWVPLRYGSMAVAVGRLFVGTRTISPPMLGADVVRSSDGSTWARSNPAGFGVGGDDATSGLASRDAYLYAGTVNIGGLEVWRRTPTLAEVLPYMMRDVGAFDLWGLTSVGCLGNTHCRLNFSAGRFIVRSLVLAGDKADDPQGGNSAAIKQLRTLLDEAAKSLDQADLLDKQSQQTQDQKLAQEYGRQAVRALWDAMVFATTAVTQAWQAVPQGGDPVTPPGQPR